MSLSVRKLNRKILKKKVSRFFFSIKWSNFPPRLFSVDFYKLSDQFSCPLVFFIKSKKENSSQKISCISFPKNRLFNILTKCFFHMSLLYFLLFIFLLLQWLSQCSFSWWLICPTWQQKYSISLVLSGTILLICCIICVT